MKHKKIFRFLLTLCFLLLLIFPSLSLEGARKGLILWYHTVLPTLLPFMICMNLMVSFGAVHLLAARSGMLCGYPMGAKNCSDFLDNAHLSLSEARCLYAVSSFPSPMFLAGYMMNMVNFGAQPLTSPLPLWKMAAAIYLPAIPLFFLSKAVYCPHCLPSSPAANHAAGDSAAQPSQLSVSPSLSLDEALLSSMEVMVKIGGYIMLFSILAAFIRRLPIPCALPTALLITIAEMTTGIEYASLNFSGLRRALIICFGGAFGGLSGAFQVHSVTKNAGLSIRHYLFWKTVHGLLAVIVLALLTGPR